MAILLNWFFVHFECPTFQLRFLLIFFINVGNNLVNGNKNLKHTFSEK